LIGSIAIPMAQVEIMPPRSGGNAFGSPPFSHLFPRACHEEFTWATKTIVNEILSTSPSTPLDSPTVGTIPTDNEKIFPSLPPLLYGHPDVHLKDGIMKTLYPANVNEPDAERAFFVADLSKVYLQHQRWKKCLPDVQPFYGAVAY
jgi:ornithine decarboxylase